jgi:hypothetical protein
MIKIAGGLWIEMGLGIFEEDIKSTMHANLDLMGYPNSPCIVPV